MKILFWIASILVGISIVISPPIAKAETFYGCKHKTNGKLRLVSAPGQCLDTEIEVSWVGGEDTSQQINELFGRINAIESALGVINEPPVVDAGPDQTILLSHTAGMEATATDDGVLYPLTYSWEKESGPEGGSASFTDTTSLSSSVTFDQTGFYVLKLNVFDGVVTISDTVSVVVFPDNTPPIVEAGEDQNGISTGPFTYYHPYYVYKCIFTLNGSVTDDGLPQETPSIEWSGVYNGGLGYGYLSFQDSSSPNTQFMASVYDEMNPCTIEFPLDNFFRLTLQANDGYYTSSDHVDITCNIDPTTCP